MALRSRTRLVLKLLVCAHLVGGFVICVPAMGQALLGAVFHGHPPRRTSWKLGAASPLLPGALLGFAKRLALSEDRLCTASPLLTGTLLSQASLVGLWSALAGARLRYRFACSVLGGAYLCSLFVTATVFWEGFTALAVAAMWLVLPLVAVAGIGGWLRRRGSRVECFDGLAPPATSEGLQFSLWHLLVFIFVMAVLLTLARWLHTGAELKTGQHFWSRTNPDMTPDMTVGVFLSAGTMLTIIFSAQTIAVLWATLGLGRWQPRLFLPALLAVIGAGITSYSYGSTNGNAPETWGRLLSVLCLNTCQWSLVAASLLVLRALGYRLVRKPAANSEYPNS
jgi:hypothetical protein